MNGWLLAATAATETAAAPQGNIWSSAIIWVVFLGIFWVFLIMPQRKQQKQRDVMIKNLKKGDKVITVGGVHGEIIEFDDDDVKLRVAEKVEMKFTKGSIARVKS